MGKRDTTDLQADEDKQLCKGDQHTCNEGQGNGCKVRSLAASGGSSNGDLLFF